MKLPWLLPILLGGGAAADLGKAPEFGTVNKVLLGRGVAYQQDKRAQPRARDGASIHSASADEVHADLDALTITVPSPKNKAKPKLNAQRGDDPSSGVPAAPPDDNLPVITFRASSSSGSNPPPDGQDAPIRRAEPPGPDSGPDAAGAPEAVETGNPASANRAIAGMGVGLVSVMLIFTVFL